MKDDSTVLNAVCIGNKLRVLTNTVTDYWETIVALKTLLEAADEFGADKLEFYLDSFDAPSSEIAAWLKNNTDATITWCDGRFSLYEIPCYGSTERTF